MAGFNALRFRLKLDTFRWTWSLEVFEAMAAVVVEPKRPRSQWYANATKYQPSWYTNAILLIGEKVKERFIDPIPTWLCSLSTFQPKYDGDHNQ